MFKNLGSTLVCTVVVMAPLPFGSAEPFWGGVWCMSLGIALLLASPKIYDDHLRIVIWLIFVVIGVWCLLIVLQYGPLDRYLREGPGWTQAARVLTVKPRVAAYEELPLVAVVPPLALILSLLTGVVFGAEQTFTQRIYRWVANAGLVYAGYALFSELTNPTMLLWREKTAYVDFVTGTFVNHNTAATFFGCVAVIWYVRWLREIRRRFDPERWHDFRYVLRKLTSVDSTQIRYILAFFVLLVTTFMTRSRAGSLLTLVALGVVTALYFSRTIKSARHLVITTFAILLLIMVVVVVAGGQFTKELETRGIYDAARADAWISALKIVRAYPWLGTGLGTFSSVFPAYRASSGGVWGIIDRAHSTPVELMVEMGLPFSLLVLGLWILMFGVLLRGAARRGSNRVYVVAGTGILTLGSLHSLVDFPLQIPGFAIVCCTLTGASLAEAVSAPRTDDTGARSSPTRSRQADILAPASAHSVPPHRDTGEKAVGRHGVCAGK
jgi:hypothetical protein